MSDSNLIVKAHEADKEGVVLTVTPSLQGGSMSGFKSSS